MEINNFDIIKEMSLQNNQSFKLFPASNVEQVSTRKNGWGFIKMAIDNLTADQIVGGKNLFIGLFVYDLDEFERIKKEMGESYG
jgi:hypothetical protein